MLEPGNLPPPPLEMNVGPLSFRGLGTFEKFVQPVWFNV